MSRMSIRGMSMHVKVMGRGYQLALMHGGDGRPGGGHPPADGTGHFPAGSPAWDGRASYGAARRVMLD